MRLRTGDRLIDTLFIVFVVLIMCAAISGLLSIVLGVIMRLTG